MTFSRDFHICQDKIFYIDVGTGILDEPAAKRPLFRRTVREAGSYKGAFLIVQTITYPPSYINYTFFPKIEEIF